MVKAHYKNDLDEYKKFGVFHTLRARGWYIALFSGLFLLCGAGLLVLGIFRKDSGIIVCSAICFAFACGYPFLNCFMQIKRIKQSVAKNRNFERTEQFFVFNDDGISLQIRIGEHTSDYEVPYSQIVKIFETATHFYIYIGRTQALILNKRDIDEGSADELAALLGKGAGKRFSGKKRKDK